MKAKNLYIGDVILETLLDPPKAQTIQAIEKVEGYLQLTLDDDSTLYYHPNENVLASRVGRIL